MTFLLLTLLLIVLTGACMGVIFPPLDTQPTLTYGYIMLAASFLILLGVSLYPLRKQQEGHEKISIQASYFICLIHALIQVIAVYVLCAQQVEAAKALTIQICILAVLIVTCILLYLSAGNTSRHLREEEESFVSQAISKLNQVRASRYDPEIAEACGKIERMLRGSPYLSKQTAEHVESHILESLEQAAQAPDAASCIASLAQIQQMIQQRNSA
jgi:cytochrome c biogenesis factor